MLPGHVPDGFPRRISPCTALCKQVCTGTLPIIASTIIRVFEYLSIPERITKMEKNAKYKARKDILYRRDWRGRNGGKSLYGVLGTNEE